MRLKFVLVAIFLAAAEQVFSQAAPAASRGVWQANIGAGVSVFHDDYSGPTPTGGAYSGAGLMEGPTVWLDIYPNCGPNFIHGLGLEVEGRDLSFGRPSTQPSNFREDTGGGGAIYSWRHFRDFSPYGKFLWEQASIDFHTSDPNYNHDNRSLFAAGAGFEYLIWRDVSVRAEYEEQVWQRLFEDHSLPYANGLQLKPRGITIGASYAFKHVHQDR
jgi:opacity protein-like surface antigen